MSEPGSRDPWSKARHDLRTPINQILGYSELLQEEAEEGGQAAFVPDLQKIQAAARKLLALIDEHLSPDRLPAPAAPSAATVASPTAPPGSGATPAAAPVPATPAPAAPAAPVPGERTGRRRREAARSGPAQANLDLVKKQQEIMPVGNISKAF